MAAKDDPDTLRKAVYGRVGLPLELEDGVPPAFYSRLLMGLTIATGFLLLWAAIGQIREVANTIGEIAPAGQILKVEHLEGGIVSEILVEEGQLVQAGDPLAHLEKQDTTTELARIQSRLSYLELEERRLLAQEYSDANTVGLRLDPSVDGLSTQQRAALTANRKAVADEQEAYTARVAQRRAEVVSLEAQVELQKSQVELEKEKFQIQEGLLKDGYTSRRRFLEAKGDFQRSQVTLEQLFGNLAQAREMLTEAQASLSQAGAEVNRDVADERARIAQERDELKQEIAKLKDRQDRLFVKAPVAGYVKSLGPTGRGAVVNPGDLIAEIVPLSENLVAEVKVNPKDVGHINIGDRADITITSYDPNIYGTVAAEVETISASSFQDEFGEYYFKATLAFPGQVIGAGSHERPIRPGMQVNAQVVTGSKSILLYLLHPVTRAARTIFTER
ncbi:MULTISPECIES: HlyD family type I secretion periplasmic adaptor subunit [Stappiaceae]|jgi:HlyD family type I secretion membrane fusion protein|uniref:Membrane fusion protein (MFP) family protein n=1 Tax=Roseibium aggregatum TaxID=187304 RepID=A0A0M6YAW7_9HYPH|nr:MULTISPECIES: HlyD family type I secretion periplasmic adaptor subunit [Stappiaceae]MCR9284220.1 HlyD family type I secretion periplasmic adaptor subunit [Paracoccaceae bacterium]MEC9419008.1 HlyD family type I secretion periplasmic adaptor subunit [Pseudomonadota bacterium]AMN51930.1 membrane protein [Labrenzia sp. CP4]MBN8184059.1 HlyD family type I secretion periplasmic adaptor subunit [Roseibium aggregatum]MBO9463478.1 HlyD family type I secretion periplasmic adaptor subunit [Labrenzia 